MGESTVIERLLLEFQVFTSLGNALPFLILLSAILISIRGFLISRERALQIPTVLTQSPERFGRQIILLTVAASAGLVVSLIVLAGVAGINPKRIYHGFFPKEGDPTLSSQLFLVLTFVVVVSVSIRLSQRHLKELPGFSGNRLLKWGVYAGIMVVVGVAIVLGLQWVFTKALGSAALATFAVMVICLVAAPMVEVWGSRWFKSLTLKQNTPFGIILTSLWEWVVLIILFAFVWMIAIYPISLLLASLWSGDVNSTVGEGIHV